MAISFDSDGRSLDRRNSSSGTLFDGRRHETRRVGDKAVNATLLKLYKWNWIPYMIIAVAVGWMAFDAFVPVLWMKGDVVVKEQDHVVVNMYGWKIRECKYLGIQSYSITPEGIRNDAVIKRVDAITQGTTRPLGYYNMGNWDIRPTTGATGVVVYAQHSCDADDLRSTKMAEVKL